MSDKLYFRQLLGGVDVGTATPGAGQMANFMYLVGDREKRECVVVDPAWDIQGLVDAATADDMKITGALVTHYHPDHIGGHIFGIDIEGLAQLQEINPVKIWVHKDEADGVKQITGVSDTDLSKVDGGDTMQVGDIDIHFVHTPGHTPGSQCFLVSDRLVSGDTLFIQGCGRVDLPGGDPEEMYYSLTQRLAKLPADTVLFPGHAYSGRQATLEEIRETNPYVQVPDLETWLRMMGNSSF